jgi:hypothetical protein
MAFRDNYKLIYKCSFFETPKHLKPHTIMYELKYYTFIPFIEGRWNKQTFREVCRVELVSANIDSDEYKMAYHNYYEHPKIYFTNQVIPQLIYKCKEREDAFFVPDDTDVSEDDISIDDLKYDSDEND